MRQRLTVYVRCVECGRVIASVLPRGGADGTARRPRRHERDGQPCPGWAREGEWVEKTPGGADGSISGGKPMHVAVKWIRVGGVWYLRTIASGRIIADVRHEGRGWMWHVSGLSGKSDTLHEAKATCEIECGVTR